MKSANLRAWSEQKRYSFQLKCLFWRTTRCLFRYVGFCSTWYLKSSYFATNWTFKLLLLYADAGTRTNCSISMQVVYGGKNNDTFVICTPLSDTIFGLRNFLSRDGVSASFSCFVTWCRFMVCTFLWSRFTMFPQTSLTKIFGQG